MQFAFERCSLRFSKTAPSASFAFRAADYEKLILDLHDFLHILRLKTQARRHGTGELKRRYSSPQLLASIPPEVLEARRG
jgi:hypothetical protein